MTTMQRDERWLFCDYPDGAGFDTRVRAVVQSKDRLVSRAMRTGRRI